MTEVPNAQVQLEALQSGTGSGLLAFTSYLEDKHYMVKATSSALRTGVKTVLEVEDERDSLDMRDADQDDLVRRFRNRSKGRLSEKSLNAYEQRFRQATDMYLRWLRNEPDWQTIRRSPSSSNGASGNKPKSTPRQKPPTEASTVDVVWATTPTPVAGVTMITYPFPIRKGVQGRITLPDDLAEKEAVRIARFIQTLVSDGDGEAEDS